MSRGRVAGRLALLSLVCGGLVAGLVSAAWLVVGQRPARGAVWFKVTRLASAEYTNAPDQPFFFLALGTDPTDSGGRGLGDGIHVIGVNPAQRKATILNISYDTQGPDGRKINEVYGRAGLRAQADAITQITGVPIAYAISTDFDGFSAMIDEIGGIDITVPQPLHDSYSGAEFQPGHQHVTGDQALRFVRDRRDYPTGDIARTEMGGALMLDALRTLQARHTDLAGTLGLLATVGRHVELDGGTSLVELYRLGRLALGVDPAAIRNVVLPVREGPGTILVPSPDAKSLLEDFADDAVLESH